MFAKKLIFQEHLTHNVIPAIQPQVIEKLWELIEDVNKGNKTFKSLLPDNETTIGDMVSDLKLETFISEEVWNSQEIY